MYSVKPNWHAALVCLMSIMLLCSCHNIAGPKPFIVASADDRATQAGMQTLKNGGNAMDAAIVVQSVLSLVEPQSSGLGGGAFMLYYDAQSKRLHTFDGRETAPASIKQDAFLDASGKPKGYFKTAFGGQAVGVPGVMALLGKAHQQYGKLAWSNLFKLGENLATNGFKVSPRLSNWLSTFPNQNAHPSMRDYFYDAKGKARPAGYVLKNPAFANTLRITAKEGAQSFYTGTIAKQIVEAVQHAPKHPRNMTLNDLSQYQAIERDAICASYHQYKVCTMAPPTSGGVFLLQTLGMLEGFNLKQTKPFSAEAVHLIIEASKLSFADRQQYIADPGFVRIPLQGLLNKRYLKQRASLINREKASNHVQAGDPAAYDLSFKSAKQTMLSPHIGEEHPSTSHFSIMDANGNVVSMTTTVQGPFGSFLPAGGFILNNQLTDFSYLPSNNGKPIANAIAPHKRPRSSMTPTIVFDADGHVFLVIGSPGGGRIFSYVLKTVLGVLDWRLSLQAAIDAPNISLPTGIAELELGRFDNTTKQALTNKGHQFKATKQTSGLNGFLIKNDLLLGGVDKRREGTFSTSSD